MKANKLVFEHVVDVSPRSGIIKLNNKRMVLAATESLGFLRKDLVQTLGAERAKSIFIRYGISNGYAAAKAVMQEFPWRTKDELILAGTALHTLAGPVMVEAEQMELNEDSLYMRGSWFYSYEYEELQHVLLFLKTAAPSQLVSYYTSVIGELIDYDQRQDAQLLHTLQVYFEQNGHLNKTAQLLNLSLPGLRYRIEKIESLVAADIKSGDGRFQCQLALQFYYAVQAIR